MSAAAVHASTAAFTRRPLSRTTFLRGGFGVFSEDTFHFVEIAAGNGRVRGYPVRLLGGATRCASRRPVSPRLTIERLMLLDAVLS
jgi:hypothetical protein